MRSRYPIFYAVAVVVGLVLCLALVCQVKSCARRIGIGRVGQMGQIGQIGQIFTGAICLPPGGGTEPQKPSIVPPGTSAVPTASRRPVFGVPSDEGTQVEVEVKVKEEGTETLKLQVRKDGTVFNRGRQNVKIVVTRYGPAWIEWDLSVGACGFLSESRSNLWPVTSWQGFVVDVGAKVKFVDLRPIRALQIGVPVIYATTAGPGVGVDFKWTETQWLAVDCGYFPMAKRWAVGVSLNWP